MNCEWTLIQASGETRQVCCEWCKHRPLGLDQCFCANPLWCLREKGLHNRRRRSLKICGTRRSTAVGHMLWNSRIRPRGCPQPAAPCQPLPAIATCPGPQCRSSPVPCRAAVWFALWVALLSRIGDSDFVCCGAIGLLAHFPASRTKPQNASLEGGDESAT
jgi:hypothetical protein